jgi:hypothetical protein
VGLLADALGLTDDEWRVLEAAARGVQAPAVLPPAATDSAPRFVGRAAERAVLESHLAGQGPPLLLFAGEPGIGKTRLLHLAAEQGVNTGYTVGRPHKHRRGDSGVAGTDRRQVPTAAGQLCP